MEVDLVGESLKFMILGMTIVFLFLYLLVLVMQFQAYIINKYFPEKVPDMPQSNSASSDAAAHVAVIIAAVADFRKNKSK